MALKYALLSCLNEAEATGYQITQTMRERMGNVWSASHQQTYLELARLLKQNLVAVETLAQSDKPDRKVYSITDSGREELAKWVNRPSERPKARDPLLLKMFAGEFWEEACLKEEVEAHRIHWQATLDRYQEIEQRYFSAPARMPLHYRLQHLALLRGIEASQAWLGWSETLVSVIDEYN